MTQKRQFMQSKIAIHQNKKLDTSFWERSLVMCPLFALRRFYLIVVVAQHQNTRDQVDEQKSTDLKARADRLAALHLSAIGQRHR